MIDCLVCLNISSSSCSQVDHNKDFIQMVRINQMFDDGGG